MVGLKKNNSWEHITKEPFHSTKLHTYKVIKSKTTYLAQVSLHLTTYYSLADWSQCSDCFERKQMF